MIWLVFVLNSILPINLNQYGIIPRTTQGLIGILFAPFLHGSLAHIISNSVPLLVLTFTLFLFYEKQAYPALLGVTIIGGFLVWLLAGLFSGPSVHIGASGVIYGLVAFFIASGIYQRSTASIIISIVVVVAYGGLIYGIFPTQPRVSWQGHLFGAIAGLYMAYVFRKRKRVNPNKVKF
jgi:membrane associated rhomboid family serine protease